MADYSTVLGVASLFTTDKAGPDGFWAIPRAWTTVPDPRDPGGVHGATIRHYSTMPNQAAFAQTGSWIDVPKWLNRMHALLSYSQWLAQTYERNVQNPQFQYGGEDGNNFGTFVPFIVAGASGRLLTLEVVDSTAHPLSSLISFKLAATEDGSLVKQDTQGAYCFPGCAVYFYGNSVLAGRIWCKIVGVQSTAFSTPPAAGDRIVVRVDTDVSHAMTARDLSSSEPARAMVTWEGLAPELWTPPVESYPLWTVEVPDQLLTPGGAGWDGATGVVTLTTPEGANCRIAFPTRDNEGGNLMWGTLRLETSVDGGVTWTDRTLTLRGDYDEALGRYTWPRLKIDRASGRYRTRLYLGASGPTGAAQSDLLAGCNAMRLRYRYEVSSGETAGAVATCQARCKWDTRVWSNVFGDWPTNGVRVDGSGRHHYCAQRMNLDGATLAQYDDSEGGCFLAGTCPYFTPMAQAGKAAMRFQELVNNQNIVLTKLAGSTSIAVVRVGTPSIAWLLNKASLYASPAGWHDATAAFAGGYLYVAGTLTDGSGNQSLDVVTGAWANGEFNFALCNYQSNRWPAGLQGVLQRRLASPYYLASTAVGGEPTPPADSYLRRQIGCRSVGVGYRDASFAGDGIALLARDQPGVEGENRVQRQDWATRAILLGIDPTRYGVAQQRYENVPSDTITFLAEATTVDGVEDVRAIVQLKPGGRSDFGIKRLSGNMAQGGVLRIQDVGGGLFKIHCIPGLLQSDYSSGGEDQVDPFYASGNVVALEWPYGFNGSYYNIVTDKPIGTAQHRAVAGDSLHFEDRVFEIRAVEAAAGDDWSGTTADRWTVAGVLRPFLDLSAGMGHTIEITRMQIAVLTPGTFQDWQPAAPMVNNRRWADRPTSNSEDPLELTNLYVDLDQTLGEVNGTPVALGTGVAFLSAALTWWAFGVDNLTWRALHPTAQDVSVNWTIDGAAQSAKTAQLTLPQLSIGIGAADTLRADEWSAYAVDPRWSGPQTLTFAGLLATEYDRDVLTSGVLNYWYVPTVGKFVFHPLLAGARVTVNYVTTTPINLGAAPVGHAELVPTSDSAVYRTRADTVTVADENGFLAALVATGASPVGRPFTVRTACVATASPDLTLSWARMGHAGWNDLARDDDFKFNGAAGRVYLLSAGYAKLTLESLAFKVENVLLYERMGNLPARLIQGITAAAGCLDTLYQPLAHRMVGQFVVEGYWTVGPDTPVPSPYSQWKAGLWGSYLPSPGSYDWTVFGRSKTFAAGIVRDFTYSLEQRQWAGAGPYISLGCFIFLGVGPSGVEVESPTGLIWFRSPLIELNMSEGVLQKLPDDATIVSARMVVSIPLGIRHDTYESYTVLGRYYGRLAWMPWLRSSPTPRPDWADGTTYEGATHETQNNDDIELTFMLLGKRNDGRLVEIGSLDGPTAVEAGKARVFNVTGLARQWQALKGREFAGFYLIPVSRQTGGIEAGFDPQVHDLAELIPTIVDAMSTVEHIAIPVDEGWFPAEGGRVDGVHTLCHAITIPATLGAPGMVVQFELSNNTVLEIPCQYGNPPEMTVRA